MNEEIRNKYFHNYYKAIDEGVQDYPQTLAIYDKLPTEETATFGKIAGALIHLQRRIKKLEKTLNL